MSIVVYAQITTENKNGFLTKDIIKNLAKLSRREQGCIKYDLITKEDGYIVFEEWESTDALEMHKSQRILNGSLKQLNVIMLAFLLILAKKHSGAN